MNAQLPSPAAAAPRISSGVAGLDVILGGGFMQGGIYIIQGNPGAGKTILTNQMCFHHIGAAQGAKALFVTLLAENHVRMMSNIGTLTFFDASMIPDQLGYISAFHELRENGLSGVSTLLRREIQRRRCSMLVLDGMVAPRAGSDAGQLFKEFVHSLQEIALATDCTMFVTSHNSLGEISSEQTMVDGLIRLQDCNYGCSVVSDLQIIKFRGSAYLRGRHAYKITDQGLRIYPRTEALLARPSQPEAVHTGKTSSGVARLDDLFHGGLPLASATLVMGSSGVGKTTLGLQFLAKSSRAEPGLLFGFSETPAQTRAKARALSKPLSALLDAGTVEILWQPLTDGLLDEYAERLLTAVRRRNVQRLFIDGVAGFTKTAVDPARMIHFFTALANELRALGVTTVYSLEVPHILGPPIRVPVDDIASIAENIMLLRFVEVRARLHRLLSVLKVRNSTFDPSLHEFTLADNGLAIAPSSASAESILSQSAWHTLDSLVAHSTGTPPAAGS